MIVMAQTAPSQAVNNTSAMTNSTTASYVQGELLVQFNPEAFPNNQSMQASSMQANAAIGAVMNRITSYNVCYTKLLRLLKNVYQIAG